MNKKILPVTPTQAASFTFYLCEKPSQIPSLAQALGATRQADGTYAATGVVISSASGHLLKLAIPEAYIGKGSWRMADLPIVPSTWIWQVSKRHHERLAKIGAYLKMADAVVIATDPDEEGEVIGRQILHALDYTGTVSRLWVSALNPVALSNSLQNLRPLSATDAYYHAGRVRHELDWLFGMNLSRAFSLRFDETIRIGRVKTCLLNELVKRDSEIADFKPVFHHTAHVVVGDARLEWQPRSNSLCDDADLLALSQTTHGTCLCTEFYTEALPPPLPYTLSALLADASDMGISLQNGYKAAQQLYECGAISYPRTSSTTMPAAGIAEFAAHHAIINTMEWCPAWLSEDAKQIFRLVELNGLMQMMGPATLKVRRLVFNFGGEIFSASDRWVEDANAAWMNFCLRNSYLTFVNNLKKSSFCLAENVQAAVQVVRKQTLPPEHFTEASLLRMMAQSGIGTEATRVETIGRLVTDEVAEFVAQSEYSSNNGTQSRAIRSTQSGRDLIHKLPYAVTGPAMEDRLQQALSAVRNGQADTSSHLLDASEWITFTIHKLIHNPIPFHF